MIRWGVAALLPRDRPQPEGLIVTADAEASDVARLTPAERRAVAVQVYAAGGTVEDAAQAAGRSAATVRPWLVAAGLRPASGTALLTQTERQQRAEQILKLYRDGVPVQEIADRMGCSAQTVHKTLPKDELNRSPIRPVRRRPAQQDPSP